jgi:predicted O-methyltransferase YrrM
MSQLLTKIRGKFKAARIYATKALYGLPSVRLEEIVKPPVQIEPPIMEKICMPPYYSVDDHDDFAPLMKLAKFIDPKVIVELGTAHGNTSANLALNCPGAKIVTVNAPVEVMTGVGTTFGLTREQIGCVYRNAGLGDRVTQVFENTLHLDLSKYVEKGSVDLGIVDACHDVEYVINDFHKVRPFMSERGVIVFHDTHPSMEGHVRHSYAACMQLRRAGFDIRHLADTWWGIWFRNPSRYLP